MLQGLALCMRPDEVLCVGLCTTLMGKVFSYMLVQELFATPLYKLQTQNDGVIIRTSSTDNSSHYIMVHQKKHLLKWEENISPGKTQDVRNTLVFHMVGGLGACLALEGGVV